MTTVPSTQDEWTIHALNIHGVFFERRCAALVADTASWKVLATNYPVEFPPPNGPWRGKESALDILARRDGDPSSVVDALIECKKANPEFVNWVFFPKPDCPTPSPFSFAQANNKPNETGSGSWSPQVALQNGSTTLSMASDAREVRGDYAGHKNDNNKTKTSNAAIQDAAYQVALATRAIIHEEISLLGKVRISPDHPAPPWMSKIYVPLIVTTAKLLRVDFSSRSAKLDSGEIDLHDATLTPVQSIVYEYALPKHLQHSPAEPLQILKSGNSDMFSRMHIFVVNAEALSAFLADLFSNSKPHQSVE